MRYVVDHGKKMSGAPPLRLARGARISHEGALTTSTESHVILDGVAGVLKDCR